MLDKHYDPARLEARVHKEWEAAGAFKAGAKASQSTARVLGGKNAPYCIVIPPPNVTGSLHMGHALNNTLQDILIRFERMRGRDVLWQPGTDHAGIATQMVVEKQLAAAKLPDRKAMGREKFLEKVWEWKATSGGTIINQLKRLGASCDWDRERFTMDPGLSDAVLEFFVKLHDAGLVYKANRLVNWDPKFQTAISDLEVEDIECKGAFKWTRGQTDAEGLAVALNTAALNKQLDKNPSGHLYYFNYPLVGLTYNPDDPKTYLTVATTRPETMLGDTAIAVNPGDKRYQHLIGTKALLPLVGRQIIIVGDDYSDPEKGSGAVKITPAHDANDFEVGKRHNLEAINIFDIYARLNPSVPAAYRGMDRFAARKQIVADMEAGGFLAKIEPHDHKVPHGDRSGVPIEPYLTEQWYVNVKPLADKAIAAVRSGETRIIPPSGEQNFYRWMENIEPWCISRQLWWGHQIPVWYGPDGAYVVARNEAEAQDKAKAKWGKVVSLTRDPDVLDTWFSSALWPFSTLGWPSKTDELERYYPNAALVTGADILFFWVARMMMAGLFTQDQIPFKDVYLHGLVRDEKGRKMSKTLGNVIDPLDVIEKYGADALRFTLASMAAPGRDPKLSRNNAETETTRNFCTKIWNAARFAEMNECVRVKGFDPKGNKLTINRWIAGEVERVAREVTAGIEGYKFNEAAAALYDFTWGQFCDWYVELIKPVLAGDDEAAKSETRAMVAWTLDQVLKLMHPFMPFITEELWAHMVEHGEKRDNLLCLSNWPSYEGLTDAKATDEIGWVVRLVSEVRSVRTEMKVPAAAKIDLVVIGSDAKLKARVGANEETIKRLARLEAISFAKTAPKGSAQVVLDDTTVALPLEGVIDMAAERARIAKEQAKTQEEIGKVDAKLGNAELMAKAPEQVLEELKERRVVFTATLKRLDAALKRIDG
jgi:valyl-tRNA synthetase